MITMLTSIAQIDIRMFKNPFKYLQTNPVILLLLICVPSKISVRSKISCLTIPKNMPDHPKKRYLTIPKKMPDNCVGDMCSSDKLIVRYVFWDLRKYPRKQARQSSGIFFEIFRHLFWDREAFKNKTFCNFCLDLCLFLLV